MKKYIVRFTTTSRDYDKEWCHARNEHEACEIIESEHWNIQSIDSIEEL